MLTFEDRGARRELWRNAVDRFQFTVDARLAGLVPRPMSRRGGAAPVSAEGRETWDSSPWSAPAPGR